MCIAGGGTAPALVCSLKKINLGAQTKDSLMGSNLYIYTLPKKTCVQSNPMWLYAGFAPAKAIDRSAGDKGLARCRWGSQLEAREIRVWQSVTFLLMENQYINP